MKKLAKRTQFPGAAESPQRRKNVKKMAERTQFPAAARSPERRKNVKKLAERTQLPAAENRRKPAKRQILRSIPAPTRRAERT